MQDDAASSVTQLGGEALVAVGDSVYFPGGVAHRWWSASDGGYCLPVVDQGRPAGRA